MKAYVAHDGKLRQVGLPLTPADTRGEHHQDFSDDFDDLVREAKQAKRRAEQKARDALREKFNESERILNILRTQGADKVQEATEEEMQTWAKTLTQ